jgi:hypothetical protein
MNVVLGRLIALLFVIWSSTFTVAQTPNLNPDTGSSPIPIVSFELERPGGQPPHYSIAVESTGRAAYRAEEQPGQGQDPGEPYVTKFTVSDPNKTRIFELAKQANRFNGKFDYIKSKIANTGAKTLTYSEGRLPDIYQYPVKGVQNQTTYNWSENPAIQQLTQMFEGMAATLEFGRRMDFARRFDKLGLDAELKRLQEMQKSGQVDELQAIAPTLTNISNDVSVMHIARERARQILASAARK